MHHAPDNNTMTGGSGDADHVTSAGPSGVLARPRNRLAFASLLCGLGAYATLPLSYLVPWAISSLEPASQRVPGGWQSSFLAPGEAIWFFGFPALAVLAIVLGHVSLWRARRLSGSGRNAAIAGMTLGYLGVVLIGLYLAVSFLAARALGS